MLFNSYEFIFIFLPISMFIFFYLNGKKLTEASKLFIVISSLFFYSWWNPIYLPLILTSMLFNFIIGAVLTKDIKHKAVSRNHLLIAGVMANIGLLGYFKYSDFLIDNLNVIFKTKFPHLHLALPLAISFFTFQQIAYLVDAHGKKHKEYNFLNYAFFVSFFPQLIAGPIVHHEEMMPQLKSLKRKVINFKNTSLGLFIFSIGLFKKNVFADTLAIWVADGFSKAEQLSFLESWITSISYTLQLYYDFSGYSDMAVGLGLLFNIKIPINFDSPHKATNIRDFWRRWHITLSRFLRAYIYVPLGGSKKGNYRTCINIMITFLAAGFWHGAGWTYVFLVFYTEAP